MKKRKIVLFIACLSFFMPLILSAVHTLQITGQDLTAPAVILISLANGSNSNIRTQYFTANFSDNSALKNVTLYLWDSTNFVINNTENRTITED